MTHTPKQTDVQARGVVLRPEPASSHMTVAPVCRCVYLGPETWFPSVFAEVADRAGGQKVSTEALPFGFNPGGSASASPAIPGVGARSVCLGLLLWPVRSLAFGAARVASRSS